MPGATTPGRFAADLLVALGKDHEALAWERQTHRSWHLAFVWLRAEALRHLVVLDADRLEPALWKLLADLATGLRVQLWLVVLHLVDPSPLEVLGLWREWTTAELVDRLPHTHRTRDAARLGDDVALPGDGFLTFRAASSEQLPRRRFATVDALYREAFGAARDWNQEVPRRDRAAIARQLRALMVHSNSVAETRVRLLAAQAAHLLDGTLIRISWHPWRGQHLVPTTGLSRRLARRLRRVATPAWACALALRAATALPDDHLAALRMKHLSEDGRRVVIAGERFDVPAHAAALVRSQLLFRRDAGARPSRPLFIDDSGRIYRSGRHLRTELERATAHHAACWPANRRWPLREDHTTGGFGVDVHPVRDHRSIATRVRRCVELVMPDPRGCAQLCRRPCVTTPSAVAESLGLVRPRRGRLQLNPRGEFSLCLTDEPPSGHAILEGRTVAADCCAVAARFGDPTAGVEPHFPY